MSNIKDSVASIVRQDRISVYVEEPVAHDEVVSHFRNKGWDFEDKYQAVDSGETCYIFSSNFSSQPINKYL